MEDKRGSKQLQRVPVIHHHKTGLGMTHTNAHARTPARTDALNRAEGLAEHDVLYVIVRKKKTPHGAHTR